MARVLRLALEAIASEILGENWLLKKREEKYRIHEGVVGDIGDAEVSLPLVTCHVTLHGHGNPMEATTLPQTSFSIFALGLLSLIAACAG